MMATATTVQSFRWNEHYKEVLQQFSCNVKPARKIRPNGSFPSLTRSLSFGSPTFPRRKSSPIRHKSKSVHFADSKGLALVSVLTYDEEKELREQFSRLVSLKQTAKGKRQSKDEHDLCRRKKSSKTQTAKLPDKIIKQLAWQKVCVGKTELLKSGNVQGEVYVANLAFEKHVKVRFTCDCWQTQDEIDGEFRSNCSKDIDKFVFEIPVRKECAVKNFKIEFAVSFTVLGDTFWDNNNGFNYHVLFASHN